ncbi:MAG TPA: phosphatidylserine decarboxylase family protein [Gemmatimonadaceae bacterium]|nr:phosphatidylserine decarboxylase family protein [Gemmatimonadaceae bacterium]
MKFAREGYPFIAIGLLLAAAGYALAFTLGGPAWWVAAAALSLIALWVCYFFRDPDRTGTRGDQYVISPADGKVLPIVEVDEPTFVRGRAMRISIFMNIFSVHVNRYPTNGTVRYLHYNPGRFVSAHLEKASLDNEQMSVGIEQGPRRVLVRQIAGLIARRIVTYSREGDRAEQGARFGLIRFGSRVDVFVPVGAKLAVRGGEWVSAGTSVLAELT